MPSPTDSTWPTSETSACSPKLAIWDLRMAEISAARMSMVLRSLQGELEGVEPRLQRGVEQAGADAHLQPAEDGGIDAGGEFRILAERLAQGRSHALELGGGEGQGGDHLGGDGAAMGGGQAFEGGDHGGQGRRPRIGAEQAEEF